jgi:predicted ATPase
VIRTPDQRIRVFVSSTLRELADERAAVKTAIERLRLAPVMFELGARPHPPRELYRSYLSQSDVFVGIYGSSYGWVAPDEEVSGLEDEYLLAHSEMPRLLYLKAGVQREPRLEALIARIQEDDTASYKPYENADELEELVLADLATLLAERFDAARTPVTPQDERSAPSTPAPGIPVPFTPLVGRDEAIAVVRRMLSEPETRLVTLLGPGGIGKSRLAIAIAQDVGDVFPDGTVFVPLENVLEAELLLPTVGYAVGVRDAGDMPLEDRLRIALAGRRMLIVLDNFEQLVGAAALVVQLYGIAPDASFLVTSRVLLRVRGERVYEVPPLATHDPDSPDSVRRARSSAAVELFVARGQSVRPDFDVTDGNAPEVVQIVRALEGLPLSIELAAARLRVLSPADMLRRLDRQLPLLVDAARDLPQRQRTLRSTIEWSTGLLDDGERVMLRDLAVFSAGFTISSIEAFGARRGWPLDTLLGLEKLVDSSLLTQEEADGDTVFSMLVSVREHGLTQLQEAGEERAARDAHAAVYAEFARSEGPALGFSPRPGAVARLNRERGNLRAAVRHLAAVGDVETAADVAWRLFLYWWVGGYLAEVALWMARLLSQEDATISGRTHAVATFYIAWRDMWIAPSPAVVRSLLGAAERFAADRDELGVAMATATAGLAEITGPDPDVPAATGRLEDGAARFRALRAGWGESLALVALGRISLLTGASGDAAMRFGEAVTAAEACGDAFTKTVALHHLARTSLFAGDLDESERLFARSIRGSVGLRHEEGIAYGLEGISAIAATRGDLDLAGTLAGAAESIRRRTAVFDAPPFVFHTGYLERAAIDARRAAVIDAALQRGRELGAYEAAAIATEPAERIAVARSA